MCGVQFKDGNGVMGLMLVLGLKEALSQLAIVSRVQCYWHVLRMEDSDVLRMAMAFQAGGQRKKLMQKRTWKKQVEEESMMIDLSRVDALCQPMWIVDYGQITNRLR